MRRFFLVCLLLLAGCGYKPVPFFMGEPDPDASDIYKQGWYDGCESGMSSYGNTFYKSFHGYKFDRELAKSGEYAKAWRDSYGYCRHHTGTYLDRGFWD